jgi:hypothetical protein
MIHLPGIHTGPEGSEASRAQPSSVHQMRG